MSRIDEALKRSSPQGSGIGGAAGRFTDPPGRADDMAVEDYPPEVNGSSPLPPPAGVQKDRSDPVPVAFERKVSPGAPLDRNNDKLVVASGRNAVSLEQYRRLAASLHEAQVERGLKTVVVTSAVPREGKTLTAVNLALTLSESYGRRVLLIDADLRRPSVHEVLGIRNDKGLNDILRADRLDLSTIQVSPLLAVLPAGRADDNPLAGLSSERMRVLLDEAASVYDWVIIDTPPLAVLSDAQLLARLTHAVVFIIRAGSTPFPVVNQALDELGREYVIGTVLNGVDEDAIPAVGYYADYYQARP